MKIIFINRKKIKWVILAIVLALAVILVLMLLKTTPSISETFSL